MLPPAEQSVGGTRYSGMIQPPVLYTTRFIPEADALLQTVLDTTAWDTRLKVRLTASYGTPYNYSGMTYPALPMPASLQAVCTLLQERLGFLPNNCLLNYYREGTAAMGFHADDTTQLLPETGVAIVSLGDTRTLTFRRTDDYSIRCSYPLAHSSLLYMPSSVQEEWQHGILKQPGAKPRISLAFRALRKGSYEHA